MARSRITTSSFRYDLYPRPVADFDALHRLLLHLLDRPDCAVVRGAPIDPDRCTNVRRLAFPDKKTGDTPTLRPEPHAWVALDLDGVERPVEVPAADLIGCAAAAVQRLPAPFRGARCIVQAPASHGIKPGCRLRLWYWLDRAATDAEMTRWLRGAPADSSMFRTVQPIYTAGPVFAPGARDHLPRRIVVTPGSPTVAVPPPEALAPPPPRPAAALPVATAPGSGAYAFAALTHAAARIGQAGMATARHAFCGKRGDWPGSHGRAADGKHDHGNAGRCWCRPRASPRTKLLRSLLGRWMHPIRRPAAGRRRADDGPVRQPPPADALLVARLAALPPVEYDRAACRRKRKPLGCASAPWTTWFEGARRRACCRFPTMTRSPPGSPTKPWRCGSPNATRTGCAMSRPGGDG